MIPREPFITGGWCFAIGISATSLGSFLVNRFSRLLPGTETARWHPFESFGVALLVGLGSLGCLATVAAAAGVFSRTTLIVIGLVACVPSLPRLPAIRRRLHKLRSTAWRRVDPFVATCLVLSAAITGMLYLSAMLLPYGSDEVGYHFPQAEIVVQSGRLTMPLGGHPYYGNIPKLMEMIFASGISLGGYSLAHALHLGFAIGFICFVGGYVTRLFGPKAGATAALAIVLYNEYTWNSTVGFVDAAAASVEVSAFLLAVDWSISDRAKSLTTAGALIGIALGIKYTPLPTALFILVLLAVTAVRASERGFLRPVLTFAAVAFLFGGGWYVRNLIVFGNPVYPFYFGHPGISDQQFKGILDDLHQFGPRTIGRFFGTPVRLVMAGAISSALALLVAPLALLPSARLSDRERRIRSILATYSLLYAAYWFFVATHQSRFLMSAVLVCLILSALVLAGPGASSRWWIVAAPLMFWLGVVELRTNAAGLLYGAGLVSRPEILRRKLGCEYLVIEYLERNRLDGTVIDNWSVWHAPNVAFYARKNTVRRFSLSESSMSLADAIRADGIRYIFLDTLVKQRHLANPDPMMSVGRAERAATEKRLLDASDLVYSVDACRLYQVDTARLIADRGK